MRTTLALFFFLASSLFLACKSNSPGPVDPGPINSVVTSPGPVDPGPINSQVKPTKGLDAGVAPTH
jgi:hypothetical protein